MDEGRPSEAKLSQSSKEGLDRPRQHRNGPASLEAKMLTKPMPKLANLNDRMSALRLRDRTFMPNPSPRSCSLIFALRPKKGFTTQEGLTSRLTKCHGHVLKNTVDGLRALSKFTCSFITTWLKDAHLLCRRSKYNGTSSEITGSLLHRRTSFRPQG